MAMLLRTAALACCYVGALGVQSLLPSEELQLRKPQAHDLASPSIGVAVRVFRGELPYLASFLQHYAKLGVDRVHLLVTRKEDYQSVDAFVKEYSFNVPIQLISTRFDWFVDDRSVEDKLTEDYIIHVDADEYLMIPPAELVASHPEVDVFILPWFMAPYDGFKEVLEAPFVGYPSKTAKSMARRSAVRQFGCHYPRELDCGSRTCRTLTTDTSLMHFNYRGLVDAAIKSCAEGGKTGDCEKAFEAGDIPGRMKTLVFAAALAEKHGQFVAPSKTWRVPTFIVNRTLEHEVMLRDFDFTRYDFKGLYAGFKDVLSDPDILRATLTLSAGKHLAEVYDVMADKPVAFFKSLKHKSDKTLHKMFVDIRGKEPSQGKWERYIQRATDIAKGRGNL